MSFKPFNSVSGYSVGETPQQTIILANGDITTTNVTAGGILSVTGNANIGNIGTGGLITATGNITGGNISGTLVGGTLTTAAQPNITSVGTLTGLSVSGTSNLGAVGNVKITGGSSGQVLSTDGTGNLTFTAAGGGFGNLIAPMPTYVATANSYLVSANFQGLFSDPITIDGSIQIDGVLAQVDAIYNASNTQIIFTDGSNYVGNSGLTFNKITSTLSTGSLSLTGTANLGAVGNVKITGGTSGYYLQTDGTGNLSWAAGGGGGSGSPGGVNTQVQFNDAGLFGGNANLTFNKTTGTLSTATLSVTGNSNVGNIGTAGLITATGNIIGGNIQTTGIVSGGFLTEYSLTISSNYTITSGKSALSVGPLNIASGVTVTVPSGSKWVIL
jgi:hypothetical protein